jgi:hypothetical protein
LPDYSAIIEGKNVIFYFKNYKGSPIIPQQQKNRPFIKPDTIEKVKRVLGRSFDVYGIESEWLQWWEQSGKPELQSPDGAFFNLSLLNLPFYAGSQALYSIVFAYRNAYGLFRSDDF